MELKYILGIQFAEIHDVFPQQTQPPFVQSDYAVNWTPNAMSGLDDIKIEPMFRCAICQPLFVPHNQINASSATIVDDGDYVQSNLPNVNWKTITLSGPGGIHAFPLRPWGGQYFDAICTDDSSVPSMALTAITDDPGDDSQRWSGFTAICTRNSWYIADGSGTASTWEIQWTCPIETNSAGDSDTVTTTAVFSVLGGIGAHAKLRRSDDGGATWKTINGRLKTSGNPLAVVGNSNPENTNNHITLEVLAFNGKMMVSLNGQGTPFVVALVAPGDTRLADTGGPSDGSANNTVDPSIAYPKLHAVTFKFTNFTQAQWHLHPTKFSQTGNVTSNPFGIGFVPDDSTPPYAHVSGLQGFQTVQDMQTCHETLGGEVLFQVDLNGSSADYTLTITNPEAANSPYNGEHYSDTTEAITKVQFRVDGIWLPITGVYVDVPLEVVREVSEQISFDPNAMTISHSVRIVLDNFNGVDYLTNLFGFRGYGNIAVSVRMGWEHEGYSPIDGLPGYQHFVGYCDTYNYFSTADGQSFIACECIDQMQWFTEQLLAAPPDMDGGNHYYWMAWLAMKAGISLSQMWFAQPGNNYVPDDPSTYTDIDGQADNGAQPYFLPFGDGLHPWTPRDRTLPIIQMMQMIRQVTGFLLFFDAYGYLRYEPLIPQPADMPKRIYKLQADDAFGYGGGAVNEMGPLSFRYSTRDTKNVTIVIGIDSYGTDWSPIVAKRQDDASITTQPGDPVAFNFKGFPAQVIWMDSRFANLDFANRAADNIHAIVRMPEISSQNNLWLQPDVFPMDLIYVVDPKSNSAVLDDNGNIIYAIPFYVLNGTYVISGMGGNLTVSTDLSGRLLIFPENGQLGP